MVIIFNSTTIATISKFKKFAVSSFLKLYKLEIWSLEPYRCVSNPTHTHTHTHHILFQSWWDHIVERVPLVTYSTPHMLDTHHHPQHRRRSKETHFTCNLQEQFRAVSTNFSSWDLLKCFFSAALEVEGVIETLPDVFGWGLTWAAFQLSVQESVGKKST